MIDEVNADCCKMPEIYKDRPNYISTFSHVPNG